MIDNSPSYYQNRCETQRRLAEAAASPAIADIHRDLETRYSQLAERRDPRTAGSDSTVMR